MLTHFLQEVRYSIVGQHGYAPHFFGLKNIGGIYCYHPMCMCENIYRIYLTEYTTVSTYFYSICRTEYEVHPVLHYMVLPYI